MSSQPIAVDVRVREIRERIAIVASGLGDPGEAQAVVKDLAEILAGGEYDLTFRGGGSGPTPARSASGNARIISSQYAGRCRTCGVGHLVGELVVYEPGVRGVLCRACGGST